MDKWRRGERVLRILDGDELIHAKFCGLPNGFTVHVSINQCAAIANVAIDRMMVCK